MISTPDKDPRVAGAFWVACALAAIGAVTPFVFGAGFGGRLAGVWFPFAVAAVAMAVNARFHYYGRLFTILLYFVGGIAIVYGVLGMLAIKLTLLVAGTCDPAPAYCPPGFQRPLTAAESDTITVVVIIGALSILAGFFGLTVMYRRRTVSQPPPLVWPAAQPDTQAPANTASAAPAPANPAPPAGTEVKASAVDEEAEPKELLAPDEPLELPAPDEPKELPPPG